MALSTTIWNAIPCSRPQNFFYQIWDDFDSKFQIPDSRFQIFAMPTIKRFEDLEVWKLAFEIANDIYDLTSATPFRGDSALRDQVRRCAISVFSNIAEGFERDGNREFINFLSIAKGSCGELRSQLVFAHRRGYLSAEQLELIAQKLIKASHQISGFQRYLRESEMRGRKFA
jgi:four helix bundle protein